jgi:serine phosphatase RsbU (regulator of sigma subunit)
LRDVVLRDVESFRGTAPQDDDVTIVVAKLI